MTCAHDELRVATTGFSSRLSPEDLLTAPNGFEFEPIRRRVLTTMVCPSARCRQVSRERFEPIGGPSRSELHALTRLSFIEYRSAMGRGLLLSDVARSGVAAARRAHLDRQDIVPNLSTRSGTS